MSNISDTSSTTIIAKKGIVNKKSIILLNGQILSLKKDKTKDEIIKFEQLNIDLGKFLHLQSNSLNTGNSNLSFAELFYL